MLIGADLAGLKWIVSNGRGPSWCDGWIWGLLGIRVLHDANGIGYWGNLLQLLLWKTVSPQRPLKGGRTLIPLEQGEDLLQRLVGLVKMFIHSSNLFQASAMCQALFRTLENYWWMKQSFCPHEAYVLRSVNNNQMNTWLNVKQHFHLMLLYSPLLLLLSHEVVSNSFVTPWTVACQAPLSMEFPRQ